MERSQYYKGLKKLAHEVRREYSLSTQSISLTTVRNIYKAEEIVLDYWPYKLKKVRAAYFLDDGIPYVLLNAKIKPKEPRIFSLCHELKHHYIDQKVITQKGYMGCQDVSWSSGSHIEIGAEIFAAEFIYPEEEFLDFVRRMGIDEGSCSKEQVVQLKRECGAPVSYVFLRKRLEWFGFIEKGAFDGVQFQKLEEQIYGVPFYKIINRKAGRNTRFPQR